MIKLFLNLSLLVGFNGYAQELNLDSDSKLFSLKYWRVVEGSCISPQDPSWSNAKEVKIPSSLESHNLTLSLQTQVENKFELKSLVLVWLQSGAFQFDVNGVHHQIGNKWSDEQIDYGYGFRTFSVPTSQRILITVCAHFKDPKRIGIWRPPSIAIEADGRFFIWKNQVKEIFISGFIFSLGLYYLFSFLSRNRLLYLAFSFCCIAIAMRTGFHGSEALAHWLGLPVRFARGASIFFLYLIAPSIEVYLVLLFRAHYNKYFLAFRVLCYGAVLISVFWGVKGLVAVLWGAHANHIITMGIAAYLILKGLRNRLPGAVYMALGSAAMIIFSLIDIYLTAIDYHEFVIHYVFIVFVLFQAMAISAINDHIYDKMKRERNRRRHSFKQLAKVFYPHQLKMMDQGGELESTMTCGPGEGVVISFDIVGSSKLDHYLHKEFLSDCISDCLSVLRENYSEETMRANGYRIKELGDGFLCSIDYPFKVPEGCHAPDLAIDMCLRFIQALEHNVAKYKFSHEVYCCSGVAMGGIQGYYPSCGTKEYDLYGRGLVLAKRYESLRKKLFPDLTEHVIILQSGVAKSISPDLRARFNELKLTTVKVRDDSGAKELYYWKIPYGQKICADEVAS